MKKNLRNLFVFTLTLLITAVTCCKSNIANAESEAALYDMVWKLVNTRYLDQSNNGQNWYRWRHKYDDKIKTPEDAYVAIDTMVASLNDKYTRFVTPKEFEEEKTIIKGSLYGIGVQIGIRDGKILVISPLEDTPGEKAGLMAYAHGQYFELGKKIGSFGFSVKKPEKKRKKHTAAKPIVKKKTAKK